MEKAIVYVRYNVPGQGHQHRRNDHTYAFSSGCWTPIFCEEDAIWYSRKAVKNVVWEISLDGNKPLDTDRTAYVYDRLVSSETIHDGIVEEISLEAEKPSPAKKSTSKKKGKKSSKKAAPKKETKKYEDGEE